MIRYSPLSTNNVIFRKHWQALISYLENRRNISENKFIEEFIKTNTILDRQRNTNFKDVNPEMADWLKI
jgi:hypothetical protein